MNNSIKSEDNLHKRFVHGFCMVRELIDSVKYPEAYRVLYFIPGWYFINIETERQAEQAAEFIIKDVRFWQWYIKQGAMLKQTRDILLALAIFSSIDNEKKILTDEEILNNFYFKQIFKQGESNNANTSRTQSLCQVSGRTYQGVQNQAE